MKRVIRKGKIVKKVQCPDKQKYVPARKKCVKMKPSELVKRKKSSKIGAKKRKVKMAKIIKKRNKSMKKRDKTIGK